MPDLLLELFSEEIPARMQQGALEHLQAALHKALGVTASEGFATPRRLAVIINDMPAIQPDITTELKGPKIDAPEAALNGFLKKNNLGLADLEKRDGIYFATTHSKGRATEEILKPIIEDMLEKFPWPKSMRWGSGSAIWVRPLQSILCIFDGKIIPVEFAGIKAGNATYGHRFLASQPMIIHKVAEYEKSLDKSFVIASRKKRKAEIIRQAEDIAAANKLSVKKDDALLEEVVGLVEFPVLLMGKIDDKFMDLPPEVLTMVMRSHQKYFALQNDDGSLSANFLITSNMQTEDKGRAIIAGNERVLRARFADARFFWDTDRKKPLSEWAEGLKTVTYHAKLGSVADKVDRIKNLAMQIISKSGFAGERPAMAEIAVMRAAELCKADLVTGMVGEFAELQGIMGRYYAMQQNEPQQVADAIRDHYRPQGPGDIIPTEIVSICVALADKIDTIISMFAIGEKPTGSKDPFALRRAALGVIRIIRENKVRLPLEILLTKDQIKAVALYKAHEKLVKKTEKKLHEPHKIGKYLSVNETAFEDIPEDAEDKMIKSIIDFFYDRLKVMLKEEGYRHDVIDAILAVVDEAEKDGGKKYYDFISIFERVKALQEFLLSENGTNLLAAYKRSTNILSAEEKKYKVCYKAEILNDDLKEVEEQDLAGLLENISGELDNLKHHEMFTEAMVKFSELRRPLDLFFEKIMVNAEDKKIRNARLCLLSKLRSIMGSIADFSKIEG